MFPCMFVVGLTQMSMCFIMATKMMRMLLNFTLSIVHVRGPVSYKMGAEVMDPWILDNNPWIIKADCHQHAPVYREIPSLD